MPDDETTVNLLVLSADTDFQLKLLNANLQTIAKELKQINTINENLSDTNKNFKELITFLYNFSLNVSVTNADLKKLNKIIEDMRDNLNPLNINK